MRSAWVAIAVVAVAWLLWALRRRVSEAFEAAPCVSVYGQPAAAGPPLACLAAGMHDKPEDAALFAGARSFRVPEGYLLQVFGKGADSWTATSTRVDDWAPAWPVTQAVVTRSDVAGATGTPPAVAEWDDGTPFALRGADDPLLAEPGPTATMQLQSRVAT